MINDTFETTFIFLDWESQKSFQYHTFENNFFYANLLQNCILN